MTPLVSIIMGSTSDYEIMEKAATLLDQNDIPFEINALSAHRTAEQVMQFARSAQSRGVKVIIAGAGMAAALPGVIAAETTLPVIGVPIKSSLEGMDSILSMIQMPPGIPVATVALNGSVNAAVLAMEILALTDSTIKNKMELYKNSLKDKIIKANEELKSKQFKNRVC
ncbi:MAG: 5-(carboxyamino)imidazole ribonucleotide mutase [Bacteroidales bacterium]